LRLLRISGRHNSNVPACRGIRIYCHKVFIYTFRAVLTRLPESSREVNLMLTTDTRNREEVNYVPLLYNAIC
jgi:hypothetical protein